MDLHLAIATPHHNDKQEFALFAFADWTTANGCTYFMHRAQRIYNADFNTVDIVSSPSNIFKKDNMTIFGMKTYDPWSSLDENGF